MVDEPEFHYHFHGRFNSATNRAGFGARGEVEAVMNVKNANEKCLKTTLHAVGSVTLAVVLCTSLASWADELVEVPVRGREVTRTPADTPDTPLETFPIAVSEGKPLSQPISWFRRQFGKPTWEEVLATVQSPSEICTYVRRRISYRSEDSLEAVTGRDTWDRESGSCLGMAECVRDLCQEKGFSAQVLCFYPPEGPGHAVAVGPVGDEFWMSSNGHYVTVRSLDEMKRSVATFLGLRRQDIDRMTVFIRDQTGAQSPVTVAMWE